MKNVQKISLGVFVAIAKMGYAFADNAFTGPYVGTGAGESFERYNIQVTNDATEVVTNNFDMNNNTPMLSGFMGYGYAFASHFYLGGQGGLEWFTGGEVQHAGVGTNWGDFYKDADHYNSMYLEATPGYIIAQHWLGYGVIGAEESDYGYQSSWQPSAFGIAHGGITKISPSTHFNILGARLGLGLRYAATDNLQVGLEAVEVINEVASITAVFNGSPPVQDTTNFAPQATEVTLDLAYKF